MPIPIEETICRKVGKEPGKKALFILGVSESRTRGGSRTAALSKMERFMIIVNGFQTLTIITKRSILDVAAVLDPPLMILVLLLDYSIFLYMAFYQICLFFVEVVTQEKKAKFSF